MKSPYFANPNPTEFSETGSQGSGNKNKSKKRTRRGSGQLKTGQHVAQVKSAYHTVRPNGLRTKQDASGEISLTPTPPASKQTTQSVRTAKVIASARSSNLNSNRHNISQATVTCKGVPPRGLHLVRRKSSKLHNVIAAKNSASPWATVPETAVAEVGIDLKKSKKAFELSPLKQRELDNLKQVLYELRKELNERSSDLYQSKIALKTIEQQVVDVSKMKDAFQDKESLATNAEQEFALKKQQVNDMNAQMLRNSQYSRTLEFMHTRARRKSDNMASKYEHMQKKLASTKKSCETLTLRWNQIMSTRKENRKKADTETKKLKQNLKVWREKCNELEQQVNEAKDILKLRAVQEKRRVAIIAEVKGDLDADGEGKLQLKVVSNKVRQAALASEISKTADIITEYEEAFSTIGSHTGISDLSEVVGKILSQSETESNLRDMIEEGQQRISELFTIKANLSEELEHIRFSGLGNLNKHRKRQDQVEARVEQVARRADEVSSRRAHLRHVVDSITVAMGNVSKQLDDLYSKDPTLVSVVPPINSNIGYFDASALPIALTNSAVSPSADGSGMGTTQIFGQDFLDGHSRGTQCPAALEKLGNNTGGDTISMLSQSIISCEQRLLKVLHAFETTGHGMKEYMTAPIELRVEKSNVMVAATRKPANDTIDLAPRELTIAGDNDSGVTGFLLEELNNRALEIGIKEDSSHGDFDEQDDDDQEECEEIEEDSVIGNNNQHTDLQGSEQQQQKPKIVPLITGKRGRVRLKEESNRLLDYVNKKKSQLERHLQQGRVNQDELLGILHQKVNTKARKQSYMRGRSQLNEPIDDSDNMSNVSESDNEVDMGVRSFSRKGSQTPKLTPQSTSLFEFQADSSPATSKESFKKRMAETKVNTTSHAEKPADLNMDVELHRKNKLPRRQAKGSSRAPSGSQ